MAQSHGFPAWFTHHPTAMPSGFPFGGGGGSTSTSLCPGQNGTTYSDTNAQPYNVYCSIDFGGFDLSTASASSLQACMAACDSYVQTEEIAGGANCVAATWSGKLCYMKYQIEAGSVNWNQSSMMSAKRVQYDIGAKPIYSAFGTQKTMSTTVAATRTGAVTTTATGAGTVKSTLSTATSRPLSVQSAQASASITPSAKATGSSGGLSTATAAGLGVGVTLAALLLLTLLICCLRRRRNRHPGYLIGARESEHRPAPKHELPGDDVRFELPSSTVSDTKYYAEGKEYGDYSSQGSSRQDSARYSLREATAISSPRSSTTPHNGLHGDKDFYQVDHDEQEHEHEHGHQNQHQHQHRHENGMPRYEHDN